MWSVKKALAKKYELPFNLSESTLSMILGGIVVILVALVAFNFFRAQRNDEVAEAPSEVKVGQVGDSTVAVALPMSHTVSEGENMWTISEKYYGSGFNSIDIIKTNKIANPDAIEVGQKLTIPKVEPREKTELVVTPAKIQEAEYTIMAGDDLWDIAVRAYGDGYKWVEIAKANKLTNPDIIHTGNVLKLPR